MALTKRSPATSGRPVRDAAACTVPSRSPPGFAGAPPILRRSPRARERGLTRR